MEHRSTGEATDLSPYIRAMGRLLDSGWFVTLKEFVGFDGLPWWVVSGQKGRDRIRADGATLEEAWICAAEQAGSCGCLD